MSNITPYDFDGLAIRVLTDEAGEPRFNANDVCAALRFVNPHKAVSFHVEEDDLTKREVIDSVGRKQQANHINESYRHRRQTAGNRSPARRRHEPCQHCPVQFFENDKQITRTT